MTTRYPGGLIRKTPPTITPPVGGEGGSAPGVWTLEQASYYTKTGVWPKPDIPRGLFAVGNNGSGELGLNSVNPRSSPVQIGALTNWTQVSNNFASTGAIQKNNTLWTWGLGGFGSLGHNDIIYRSSPTQVGALTNWSSVAMGYLSCAAIKTDGTLWGWGNNGNGQLGTNNLTNYSSPVQIGSDTNWSKVTAGIYVTAAIKTDGTLWIWGAGQANDGMLPIASVANAVRSSPTQVGALNTWLDVSVGQYFCVATQTNGTIWGWARNTIGQLGLNDINNRSSPTQIGALTNWSLVQTSGYLTTVARKNDGTIWTWGRGGYGGLGNNNTIDRSSPVQVGSDTNWSSQISSLYLDGVAAIKTDGTLWMWGFNAGGRFGQNNTVNYSSPVQVGSETTWDRLPKGFTYSPFPIKKL